MRAAFWVAVTEMRRRLRDRSVIITAFVAPFALAAIMGIAFHPSASGGFVTIGLADLSPTPAARAVVDAAVKGASIPPEVSVVRYSSFTAMRNDVRRGRIAGGVVVPPDFVTKAFAFAAEAMPLTPQQVRATATVVGHGNGNSTRPPSWAPRVIATKSAPVGAAIAADLVGAINSRLAAGTLAASVTYGGQRPPVAQLEPSEVRAAGVAPAVLVVNRGQSARQSLVGYFAPAMAIVFLFIGAGTGARSILAEREGGTLARLVAAPVRAASVIGGKIAGLLGLAILSILTMWVATSRLFGASWGATGPVLALSVATAVSMAGVAILVAANARDQARADLAVLITGLVLALFGGNFFPPGSLPPLLAKLSLATPNGWALQGFGDLALDGAGARAIVGPVIALTGFALVCGSLALVRARQVIRL
ncbi:MAG TPA: ABC transporter permease [Acidimicrobiales bacterium]|nr:ABC transporter permease [Acidimicrobiales bacterium]